MTSFLEGPLAQQLFAGMNNRVYDVTLVQVDDAGNTTDIKGRGFVDNYSDFARFGGMADKGDAKVVILQKSLPPFTLPKRRDRVKARRANDPVEREYTVVEVDQDPAQATWELQARPWS